MFGSGIGSGVAATLGGALVGFLGLFSLSFVVLSKLFGLGALTSFFGGFAVTVVLIFVLSAIYKALTDR